MRAVRTGETPRLSALGRLPPRPPRQRDAQLRSRVLHHLARLGEQLPPAAHAEALVERLDVVVNRVAAQLQLVGDLLFAAADQEFFQRLGEARRQVARRLLRAAQDVAAPQAAQLDV